jgi:hypothetical protein
MRANGAPDGVLVPLSALLGLGLAYSLELAQTLLGLAQTLEFRLAFLVILVGHPAPLIAANFESSHGDTSYRNVPVASEREQSSRRVSHDVRVVSRVP